VRRGFTVIEMMFALAIFTIVTGSLGSAAIGIRRLIGRTYAETELSVRVRALREKLLFHAVPTVDGRTSAGLLSGAPRSANAVESGTKVNVRARALVLADGKSVEQSIEFVRASDGGTSDAGWFVNDGAADPWRSRWLRLDGLGDRDGADASPGYLVGDSYLDDRALDRNLYFINLRATLNGVTHAERIVVPVFGGEQEKNATAVFHDNLLP